jgi:hypothetical protein
MVHFLMLGAPGRVISFTPGYLSMETLLAAEFAVAYGKTLADVGMEGLAVPCCPRHR